VVDGLKPSTVLHDATVEGLSIPKSYINRRVASELATIAKRRSRYLGDARPAELAGRTVVVVDDGIATGATVEASLLAVKNAGAARVVLAVPVAPADTTNRLREQTDDLVCLSTPRLFGAVGAHYEDFGQVGDAEVVRLLAAARSRCGGSSSTPDAGDGNNAAGNDTGHAG
jgi:putative phosphoribosyl transferase